MDMHEVKILVVGHLPSDDNLSGIRSRDQDISESARRKWSTTTALILPVYRALGQLVDTTYCPSTVRHHDTAKLMTASLGIEKPIADYRLNNIDYGEYKGKALKCTPPAHEALIKPYLGGESWLDMASRWREFFSEKMEHHSGCCILLAQYARRGVKTARFTR